ncbi:serine hydrolase domain-containing protein [Pseudalkalibacillus sp. Hm43]|uniref:serine hydrolase domain-containing protein n=1 Tax=Pseudalkalibacillus sp. Hm43 TaxID=3450742 RepID=UPI003F431F25
MNRLDAIVEDAVRTQFPGCVVKVLKEEKTVYEKAEGYRQTEPTLEPVNMETIFDIASLTKIMTTTMILQLISQEKLRMDTCVGEFLNIKHPKLREKLESITLFQLLTHSSGLIAWHPFYTADDDFCSQLHKLGPNLFQAEKVKYSDVNFILLGKVIEETTGHSLNEAVRTRICVPLGLSTMKYGPVEAENVAATEFGNHIERKMCEERSLTFNRWRRTDRPIIAEVNDGNTHYFFRGVSGHAGLFSNVDDVLELGRIYIDPSHAEKVDIQPSLIDEIKNTVVGSRSLGFEWSPNFPGGYGHTGFTGTSLFIHPEQKIVVVILTNRLHQIEPVNINTFRRIFHEAVLSHT